MKRWGVALGLVLAGCSGSPVVSPDIPPEDAAIPNTDTSAVAPTPDAGEPCALGGSGRLRVTVALDPSLGAGPADVWLSARCSAGGTSGADALRAVRVVRWDRSATQTIDGLGPGAYAVFASSFVAPGVWSPEVRLAGVATGAVPITLQGSVGALARFSTAMTSDAGVGYDAGDASGAGGEADAARLEWRGRAAILRPADRATVGEVELTASASNTGSLMVNVLVRNTCAAQPCGLIEVRSAEVRTVEGEAPVGIEVGEFLPNRIQVGDVVELPRPIEVRGALPDGRARVLEVAVYGVLVQPRP